MNYQIAVDGPAGSGKSTVAKKVAKALGIIYLDTGAMFRALTYRVLKLGLSPQNPQDVKTALESMELNITPEKVFINSEDVTLAIRKPEISRNVSAIAMVPEVRGRMKELQREIASETSVIMDGRDIGTAVLPEARYKFFLVASIEERARRRAKELNESGFEADIDSIAKEIELRDKLDSERECAPLMQAADALLVDTTQMTIEDVVTHILNVVEGEA